MSDVEKLFVKLHERNKSILEQVRQRTESYCQHLASKLLIAGFNPPSWLLDPDSASGSEELNKEDLISKLVRLHPQPSASCSVVHYPGYGKLVVNGENEEFSDGDFVENSALNKNLERKNDPTAPGFSGQEHGECVLNMVPELDASVASPEDQADERIIKLHTAPDHLLSRIQRSKSRQKALELRSSAKAQAKSGLRHESTSDVVSSQIRFSLSNTHQPCQNDELSQLAETCVIGSQSFENRNVVGAHWLSKKTGVDTYSERNTRSESYAEVPISFPLGCSSENYKENASSQDARARRTGSMPISDYEHADNHVNKSSKSAEPSANSCENFRDRRVEDADFLCKDGETNVYTGQITRSEISRKQQSCGRDSTKADSSSNDYSGIDITMMDSGDDPPPDFVVGSLVKVNLSNVRNEGCDAQESGLEDFSRHKERDTFPSSSSIQHNAFIDDISHLEVPYASAKVHGGILAPSSAGSARQVNDSQELSGLVKPSAGLFRRVTRSQSRSYDNETYQPVTYKENPSSEGTKFISDCEEKSAEKLQNTSSGQSVSPCLGTHNMVQGVNLFAPSSAGSARQVNDLQELSGLVKPSAELFRRVTMSQSRSYDNETYQLVTYNENSSSEGTKSISDCEGKSAKKLQNTSSGQSVSLCLGTHNMRHDDKNGKLVMARELVLLDLVDHSCLSSSNNSKQIRGLESELEFKETEEFKKALTSTPGKKSLDNLLQKTSCSLHVPDVSPNKGICVENNQPSSSKQLLRMSDVSSKEEEVYKDSFDPDAQESSDTRAENIGPVIGSSILNAFGDCAEAELTCRSSEVQDKADNLPSKMADITDIQNPLVKLHIKHGLESSPVHCMEQGEFSDEGRDKGQLVPSVSESKNLRLSYDHNSADDPEAKSYDCSIKKVGTNPIAINETKQNLAHQSPMLSWPDGEVCREHGDSSLENNHSGRLGTVWLHGKNSSLERRFTHMRIESWPQVKRRKVEHQQAHFTTSQSFRMTKPHSFKKDPGNTYPKTMEIDADTELVDHANKIMDDEICSEVNTNQIEGIQSAILSQHGEVGPCYIDARTSGDQQHIQHLHNIENNADNLNIENSNLSSTLQKEIQESPKWEDGVHIPHSVLSSSNGDLQFTDVDQSMPEFEGFVVNTETDTGELDFAADGFDLGVLELPTTTLDRASFLAEICRSASSDRLSSHFSSAFKFEIHNLCKSVPDDGHLKVMEFGNIDPLNSDVGVHFQPHSSSSDDYKDSLDGMPYSVSLACSGERYGWNSRNHPSSPVGKLWDQLSSHSGSSGKGLSSNPELTCFPIEEDPSSSEDNKTMEDDAGDTLDEIDSSLANHCNKRHPLEDLTNMGKTSSTSVSAEKETLRADSVDYMRSKFSVTGTEDKVLLGPNQTDGRKHQLSSFKKAKESVNNSTCKSMNNSISKPVVSNKTSLKGQGQKLSLRESRRNNIVSNVSSFIPLIKQKQAAPSCTGKRDVKVKALETAEAAKRLEEKKENERKMRKEALKLERAKMEEKNLRHMELEKKRKEEERKKKDADIIVKKRLREEEERKEKRKKRMRLEARQQQREQEEKKRAERPEKENQRTKDDQMNSKKEFNNESKRKQNRQTTRGEGVALQKTQINLTQNEVVMNYEECGTSGLSCEAGEVMHVVDKSPRKEDLLVQNSLGNSYEISPYQCSDDEDEKDDQLRTKKYVPSWARKSSVALVLPLQLELDPDVVFPSDSCCSIDELLLPRKLQQKRVAA
ncbi:inner centromere protein [Perilla frutescens var. hirtella]|uniref:Inner centromere protein n=1 Tax=Perilla frutescens var. hirtella TaxID=608512 RepID=A0AAD4IWK5_PERFH|nr:inner centromere protein [Perilla frutescens var. hirtella]